MMQRKKYKLEDYNKLAPHLDATKYFLIYEGTVKEPNYFQAFNESFINPSNAYLHHILESQNGVVGNTPLKLKERAENFIKHPPENLTISPSKDDKFRFILDVDQHPKNQIIELNDFCRTLNNASIYLSNFCFEVWLWSHVKPLNHIKSNSSKQIKKELGELNIGNYPFCFMDINLIRRAISECRRNDTANNHFIPQPKNSRIYLLIEELLENSIFSIDVDV